jgi:hypothetical protein
MENDGNYAILRSTLAVGVFIGAATLAFWGCGAPSGDERASEFLLATEPAGAVDVLALRTAAQDQQDVVVVGRVGGRKDPWIKGMAAFPIVDRSLKACSEIPGDACPTPWDYCCEPNLAAATALVRIVDESGNTIKEDPRELLNLKELQTVVIKGKAKRDQEGNVTVLASQLHIRPDQQAKP